MPTESNDSDTVALIENDIYYFHPDHLGSTSYLTNKQGNVSQHVEYIPFGETLIENHLNNQNNPYLYNGKELDAETGFYYYGARYYDPKSSLWLSVDPLAEKMPDFSAYAYAFNNPVMFVDPTGMENEEWDDDFYIRSDGSMQVVNTNDNFDRFYLENIDFDGNTNQILVGQFDKNQNNLIQLPSNFSFEYSDFGVDFGFNVKSGNESRSFINPNALASLIGALSVTDTKDLTIIGFSNSDGSSPKPSTSHKNGLNGDFRYFSTDKSGDAVLLRDANLDIDRQNTFNEALNRFGWKSMLSENFTPANSTTQTQLEYTTHYNKSRHHNHIHVQGYSPNLSIRGAVLLDEIIIPIKK